MIDMEETRRDTADMIKIAEEAHELMVSGGDMCAAQAAQSAELLQKLSDDDIFVSVIGQFKRGKSTLTNRLLGEDIMPVGIIPITSAVTMVRYGEKSCDVYFENGIIESIDAAYLPNYISEEKNSNNRLGVRKVVLHTEAPFLKNGLTFVDTPGVGSFHKNNTQVAYEHMKASDAVIFLLSVDSPINQIEIDFLYSTREFAGKFYFAVNKTDIVSKEDLDAYTVYCRSLLCELMETDDITLFPVSSATGEGVETLKSQILYDCEHSIREIMRESTRKKLHDTVVSTLQQLGLYWNAMTMSYEALDDRFSEMRAFTDDCRSFAEVHNAAFEIRLNELKLVLAAKVCELFGMEYKFDIDEMKLSQSSMKKDEYLDRVNSLCDELLRKLSSILMYREENAYTVVRQIEDINKLTRRLRSIENRLSRM